MLYTYYSDATLKTNHQIKVLLVSIQKPVVLLILDGFGDRQETENNAVALAKTPNLDALKAQYAYNTIDASERMVGLPTGQFGNSEVGHLNIGAGRVVPQDITRIDMEIESGEFAKNHTLQEAFKIDANQRLHLLGLFSDGGVHAHINHIFAAMDAAIAAGVKQIVIHPSLDGRDTPPRSAASYLKELDDYVAQHPEVKIGSIIGRFYSMDRDNRWDRVETAYNALFGDAEFHANSATDALEQAYARNENDEFVKATIVQADATLQDGDHIVFLNFRADRARELTQALTFDDFAGFEKKYQANLGYFASITSYGAQYTTPVMYSPQSIKNGLGEYVSSLGLRQLRIAETEKYPHVTYFFSGGNETPYPLEERILVPSPDVATYDLQPEMSAFEVCDHIVNSLNNDLFDLIICNFANGDMVGHTGNLNASIKAVETLDACVGKITEAALAVQGQVLITADHGNCENMFDHNNQQAHTQHTTNQVPFLYVGKPAKIQSDGALKDIAPSLLAMLNVAQPQEMTGNNLIEWIS